VRTSQAPAYTCQAPAKSTTPAQAETSQNHPRPPAAANAEVPVDGARSCCALERDAEGASEVGGDAAGATAGPGGRGDRPARTVAISNRAMACRTKGNERRRTMPAANWKVASAVKPRSLTGESVTQAATQSTVSPPPAGRNRPQTGKLAPPRPAKNHAAVTEKVSRRIGRANTASKSRSSQARASVVGASRRRSPCACGGAATSAMGAPHARARARDRLPKARAM